MNHFITSKSQGNLLCAACLLLSTLLPVRATTTNITSSADAGLFENNPNNNLGGMGFVTAGTTATGFRGRALFKFDVAAALPTGAVVSGASVTFKLGTAHGIGQNFELHRVLANWGEGTGSGLGGGLGAPANAGEVTWNSRFHGSSLWSTPGGALGTDFVTALSASSVLASPVTFSSGNMAADAQLWLNNSGTNFGWVIIAANEATTFTASRIVTREDVVNRPVLTLIYTVPAPATPPLLTNVTASASQFIFNFAAEADRSYTVESRASHATGSWNSVTNFPSQPSATIRSVTNQIAGAEGYFRVRTP